MHEKVTEVDERLRRHTEYSWKVPQSTEKSQMDPWLYGLLIKVDRRSH